MSEETIYETTVMAKGGIDRENIYANMGKKNECFFGGWGHPNIVHC